VTDILEKQVTSPVQWETTVTTLLGKGLEKSYELGPGKVKGLFIIFYSLIFRRDNYSSQSS
jgi:malonyl CoA-acyl carrier protein transacylase